MEKVFAHGRIIKRNVIVKDSTVRRNNIGKNYIRKQVGAAPLFKLC